MKILISSSGSVLSSLFDKRFGRSAWFCIYSEDTGESHFIKNENKDIPEGAGKNVVAKVKELGIKKTISGDFGAKTQALLHDEGTQMIILQDETKTIQEIITMIK